MTHRTRLASIIAGVAALAACGGDGTARPLPTDAAAVAQTFAQLADSVARNGGNTDVGTAYGSIAGILRMGGRITPITLTIDGASKSFLATAMSIESVTNPCPPNADCFAPEMRIVQRSLIAWDRDNPTQIVQLSSSSDDESIGTIKDSTSLALWAPMASLIYMDGAGGTFFGTSGTQKFVEFNTKALCPAPVPPDGGKDSLPIGIARPNVGVCTLTDADVSFDGKLEPSPFLTAKNSAVGTHTIAMAKQSVPGAHTLFAFASCDTACTGTPNGPPPKVPTPPVVVRPSNELPAQLSAAVSGNVVTLTLTVKNSTGAAADVKFATGQKYDFVVIDSLTGKEAWRWAMGKGFTQTSETKTVPANGALTFTETWTAPAKGLYLAHGVLVSTSHRAEAYASVIVR